MPFVGGATSGSGGQTLICSQVLSGTQATFDTNTIIGGNIPGSFTHLLMRAYGRASDAVTNETVSLQFNGDTGANYDYANLQSNAAGTVAGGGNAAQTSAIMWQIPGSTGTAGRFSSVDLFIPMYAGTTGNKVWTANSMLMRATATTDMFVIPYAGNWRSTTAVTRIVLTPVSGSFVAGSAFHLYGI